jgi:PAP2 superfamily
LILATLHWISWHAALEIAVPAAVFGLALRGARDSRLAGFAAFARELALVLVLYAFWQRIGAISVVKLDGAVRAGAKIWHWERVMHLPNERIVQRDVLPYSWLVQSANAYYATVHVPAMMIFLPWLWFFHRTKYSSVRNVVALTTFFCLLIQLIPVAPPRLVPSLHVIDTPALYHQTVYPSFGASGPAQLSAMPSVHVAWALIVGITIVIVAKSRWRWIALAHPILTMLVVVVTGNHYWLDGIVAGVLAGFSLAIDRGTRAALARYRRADVPEARTELAPEPISAG